MTLHKDRIDILTHYYPPVGGPGSRKMVSWARFFSQQGYRVRVVMPEARPEDPFYDPGLARAEGVEVIEVPIRDLSRRFRRGGQGSGDGGGDTTPGLKRRILLWVRDMLKLPDHKRTWNRAALRAIQGLPEQAAIIFSTSPYDSTHLIALKLKTADPDRYWVADFRDSWNHRLWTGDRSTPFHRWYNRRLEGKVLDGADLVTWFHEIGIGFAEDRQGDAVREKSIAVRNGIDPATIEQLSTAALRPEDGPLRVVHAGTLWAFRYAPGFVKAWRTFVDRVERPVELHFYGPVEPEVLADLKKLDGPVTFHGSVPREQVLAALVEADAHLVMASPAKEALTSKIFESVAAQRPILFFGHPEGSGAGFLREYGAPASPASGFNEAGTQDLLERYGRAVVDGDASGFVPDLDSARPEIDNQLQLQRLMQRMQAGTETG